MIYGTLDWCFEDDGFMALPLDRPEELNSFSLLMAHELIHAFTQEAMNDAVTAVVVTGRGRAFCAGMDLTPTHPGVNVFGINESLNPDPTHFFEHHSDELYAEGIRDLGGRLTLAIHALPKPVIAAINGAAVGIGATMTLAMDLRLASTAARVGFVFGRLGIVPEACSTWFLPRIVGIQQALEWIYAADILDSAEILRGRLVRSLHEPEDLLPAALELARSFVVNRSPVAIGLAKQMLYRNSAVSSPFEAHLAESLAMLHTTSHDGKEGVAAFLEKRTPNFTEQASTLPRIFP